MTLGKAMINALNDDVRWYESEILREKTKPYKKELTNELKERKEMLKNIDQTCKDFINSSEFSDALQEWLGKSIH